MTLWFIGALIIMLPVVFVLGRMDGRSQPPMKVQLKSWDRNLERWETLYEMTTFNAYWFLNWRKGDRGNRLAESPMTFPRGATIAVEWSMTSRKAR